MSWKKSKGPLTATRAVTVPQLGQAEQSSTQETETGQAETETGRVAKTRNAPTRDAHEAAPLPAASRGPEPDLEWVPKYIEELATNGGQKGKAAEAAGTNRTRVYEHRIRDPEFAKLEASAMERAREVVEDEIRRRAVVGMESVYTTKDGATKVVRTFSDTLILRLAERQETGSWRQKQQIEHSGGLGFKTEADRKAALEKARAIAGPVNAIHGRS